MYKKIIKNSFKMYTKTQFIISLINFNNIVHYNNYLNKKNK